MSVPTLTGVLGLGHLEFKKKKKKNIPEGLVFNQFLKNLK